MPWAPIRHSLYLFGILVGLTAVPSRLPKSTCTKSGESFFGGLRFTYDCLSTERNLGAFSVGKPFSDVAGWLRQNCHPQALLKSDEPFVSDHDGLRSICKSPRAEHEKRQEPHPLLQEMSIFRFCRRWRCPWRGFCIYIISPPFPSLPPITCLLISPSMHCAALPH